MNTEARRLAIQAAAIKTVSEALSEAEAATKTALQDHMSGGDRLMADLVAEDVDYGSLATISRAKTSAKADVTDRAAFTTWVAANHPGEVTRPVTVDADDLALLCGEPDDGRWSEVFDRLGRLAQIAPPVVRPAFQAHVLAECVKARAAVDPATGEVIPGVTYTRGGRASYISVRQSDDQREAVIEAHNRGDLDLLALATTPPAIQAGA